MRYLIKEGKPEGEFNASSKARQDVEKILISMDYKEYYINTKYGVQVKKYKKPLQFITYLKNKRVWEKQMQDFKEGDTIVFQYPVLNTTFGLAKILKKHKNRINIIAIIHDMDSLRFTSESASKKLLERVKREDRDILNSCTKIVCHNYRMKEELTKLGNNEKNIYTLEIFDYLLDEKIRSNKFMIHRPIVIAGNLSKEKAEYLYYLNDLDNLNFNLYGVGYYGKKTQNVFYKGKFKPEELIDNLEGSFGLVWDGNSIKTCEGGFGKYLRYNNPHKASMYLAAGLPIITWREAAIAKFVIENKVGLVVDSLNEISDRIIKMSEEEYNKIKKNVLNISKKIQNGYYLENVLRKIE